jgi:hypothetical protein
MQRRGECLRRKARSSSRTPEELQVFVEATPLMFFVFNSICVVNK